MHADLTGCQRARRVTVCNSCPGWQSSTETGPGARRRLARALAGSSRARAEPSTGRRRGRRRRAQPAAGATDRIHAGGYAGLATDAGVLEGIS
jgi:hypothetical protein